MPKLTGIFEEFKELERVPVEEIKKWLKFKVEPHNLENFIANRVLYPQTVPVTLEDLLIDLAILREIVNREPSRVFNGVLNRLTIPGELIGRFGDLRKIVAAILVIISLKNITQVFLKTNTALMPVGSILTPVNLPALPVVGVYLDGKFTNLKMGDLAFVTVPQKHIRVRIANLSEILATGGTLGTIIDLRNH